MAVLTGLERLLSQRLDLLREHRVGVIVNPTSVDAELTHLVDLFWEHPEIDLRCLMGPQHGARGETQDNMIEWHDYRDPATKLPVYSLYARTRKPTPAMLQDVDVLVFDIQDVGARYYTFIHTMVLAMEACAQYDKRLIVLDRPNPLNGLDLEGPVLQPAFRSFVGIYPLAIRHGMTVAELARYFNSEFKLGCRLEVVPMKGWKREMFYNDTGLPWIMPSPNIPTLDTALVYAGMCLLEGTNVSEGRGTTRPFELSGAPWVDARGLMEKLKSVQLPGVVFRTAFFVPTFHKWSGELVTGVQIHVSDRCSYRPFKTALALLRAYRQLGNGDFCWKEPPYEYEYQKLPIDILAGTDRVRLGLEQGATPGELNAHWQPELEAFEEQRRPYLLY